MSDAIQAWQTTIHAIVTSPAASQVLMRPGAEGWELPSATIDRALWQADAAAVNTVLRPVCGEVITLRYVAIDEDAAARRADVVFVVEPRDPTWLPPDGSAWADSAQLAELNLTRPELRPLIAAHLAETASGPVSELRPPWAQPGWFAEAAAWLEAELARHGDTLAAPVEQVKSWGISCILRAQTTSGTVYFKVASSLPLFAHEPLLMQRLAALYPACIPAPLSIDVPHRWMLLADFGPAIGWNAPVEVLEEMLVSFATLQRDAAARPDDLLAMGCLDRSLARLADQVDPLLADTATMAAQLDADAMARLRRAGPRLKAMCARLASYAVPHTLVHGDLHLGNVARSQDGYLFFDWTDACLAHPFFDTISVFQTEHPDVEERLRDAYLRVWTDYEPMERLLEAWTLAKPLLALHQAVSYQHIIASLETIRKPENQSGLPYWLRIALDALPEG